MMKAAIRLLLGFVSFSGLVACKTDHPADTEPKELSIFQIQGSGRASEVRGEVVKTEGVVTAVFPSFGGYFMQDVDGDDNDQTSDGIFVLHGTHMPTVGDLVSVVGTVSEEGGSTQLVKLTTQEILQNEVAFSATEMAPPFQWEAHESMLVFFGEPLFVIANRDLGRYGELTLSAEAKQYMPSQLVDPNDDPATGISFMGNENVSLLEKIYDEQLTNRVILNDGLVEQNVDPISWGNYDTAVLTGTQFTRVEGVVHQAFGRYGVEPIGKPEIQIPIEFSPAEIPANTNLSVASFNLENYFNGNGNGSNFNGRGARNQQEFERQTSKIIAAIRSLDADIIGLQELENDGEAATSSLAQLTKALNDSLGTDTYGFIGKADGVQATDAIRNAFLYRKDKVEPVGAAVADDDNIHLRVPITQVFRLMSNDAHIMVTNVHLRSRSCSNASGEDEDQGQGCYNARRVAMMQVLNTWLQRHQQAQGVGARIILGDFNAYAQEDPLDKMRSVGMKSILPDSAYTYVFQGRSGALDHMLVSESLAAGLLGSQVFHLNADLPEYLDYGIEFNPAPAFQPNGLRSSDHDPIIGYFEVSPEMNRPSVEIAGQNEIWRIDIFPNPISEYSRIHVTLPYAARVSICAKSPTGSVVWEEVLGMPAGRSSLEINAQSWPSGMYWVTVMYEGQKQVMALCKP